MSAILNTLKKLEEEKSVFEQNLDVQDLALHHEFGSTSTFVQANQKRNNLLMGVSAIIFLIILVGLFFFLSSDQSKFSQNLTASNFFNPPKKPVASEIKLPKDISVSGVYMSQINGDKVKNIKPESITLKTHRNNSTTLKDLEFKGQDFGVEKNYVRSAIQKDFKRSEEYIKNTNDEFLRLFNKKQIEKNREKAFSKSTKKNHFNTYSIKLKGIIYFSEGSPSNYIFVSSPQQSNKKLKVGESIVGIKLQSIQPSRAVFTKNGRIAFVEIGK